MVEGIKKKEREKWKKTNYKNKIVKIKLFFIILLLYFDIIYVWIIYEIQI